MRNQPCKPAELTQLPFMLVSRVAPGNGVSDGVQISQGEWGFFYGEGVVRIDYYCIFSGFVMEQWVHFIDPNPTQPAK